jgi:hypothetical protein
MNPYLYAVLIGLGVLAVGATLIAVTLWMGSRKMD